MKVEKREKKGKRVEKKNFFVYIFIREKKKIYRQYIHAGTWYRGAGLKRSGIRRKREAFGRVSLPGSQQ